MMLKPYINFMRNSHSCFVSHRSERYFDRWPKPTVKHVLAKLKLRIQTETVQRKLTNNITYITATKKHVFCFGM